MDRPKQYDRSGDDFSFEGYIKLSSKKWDVVIVAYRFLPWLALVGGCLQSTNAFCAFIVKNWVHTDYMKEMIGHLFMVKKHDQVTGNKDKKRQL